MKPLLIDDQQRHEISMKINDNTAIDELARYFYIATKDREIAKNNMEYVETKIEKSDAKKVNGDLFDILANNEIQTESCADDEYYTDIPADLIDEFKFYRDRMNQDIDIIMDCDNNLKSKLLKSL